MKGNAKDSFIHLIKLGCNVNEANCDGNTPFHELAKNGKKEMVDVLLKYNGDVNSLDKVLYKKHSRKITIYNINFF